MEHLGGPFSRAVTAKIGGVSTFTSPSRLLR